MNYLFTYQIKHRHQNLKNYEIHRYGSKHIIISLHILLYIYIYIYIYLFIFIYLFNLNQTCITEVHRIYNN